jgi:Na+/H+ antiporter NhaD/arsenite permease-like protein
MNTVLFLMLIYFAAGIVFITREADQQAGKQNSMPQIQHPVLRISSGMVIMLLWPAFLLDEIFGPHRSPMAVRTENSK